MEIRPAAVSISARRTRPVSWHFPLKAHTPRLMSLPGVVGVGEGRCAGAPCVKVLVLEKTPELVERIGDAIEGYKVEVVETGEIRALDSD